MITAAHVARVLEEAAPRHYQEGYDNSGFQVGDPKEPVTGVLLALDFTEAVLQEAIAKKCNMVIAHHPIIFSGLKSLTGKNYVERVVIMSIRHQIVLYAAHTNLDNVHRGVNHKIAEKIGLQDMRVLRMQQGRLFKLISYVPQSATQQVLQQLFAIGAGKIGKYSECSFTIPGIGTFKPDETANPTIGTAGGNTEQVEEHRVEVLVEEPLCKRAIEILKKAHPYEEVAYELVPLANEHQHLGSGMIGKLSRPLSQIDFLRHIKESLNVDVIKYTSCPYEGIEKVAVCGGSGSFLLPDAVAQGAQAFISADFKYHQFFDADNAIMIADIGHYETEQFTPELIGDILTRKLPNIALHFTDTITNPVKYFH